MAFIETEFPRTVSFKSMGGPGFSTTVNPGFSGFEQRNQNWSQSRGKWTIALQTPTLTTGGMTSTQEFIDQLQAFFLCQAGQANGFRFLDFKDYTSTQNGVVRQYFGTGTGTASSFQLVKTYICGTNSYQRVIWKPITSKVVNYLGAALTDTVAVFLGSTPQLFNPGYVGGGTAQFTLDHTTGIVCFGAYSVLVLGPVTVSGTTATYQYSVTSGNTPQVNQAITITAMGHSVNDFPVGAQAIITSVTPTSATQGSFTITNASAVSDAATNGVGIVAAAQVTISAASQSGSTTTYTYSLVSGSPVLVQGMRVTIAGFTGGFVGNNGTFFVSGLGGGTFSVQNASGVTHTQAATGFFDWVPANTSLLYATYQYHYPVRFETDQLDLQLEESNVSGPNPQPIVTWSSIGVRELRMESGSQG